MRLLSARVLLPVAAVVIAWGGAHLLVRHDVSVAPAVWPGATASAAPPSPAAATATTAAPATAPALSLPIIPGALQQLNADTRDTAVGLYGLVTEIEAALSGQLGRLVQQLEPGR